MASSTSRFGEFQRVRVKDCICPYGCACLFEAWYPFCGGLEKEPKGEPMPLWGSPLQDALMFAMAPCIRGPYCQHLRRGQRYHEPSNTSSLKEQFISKAEVWHMPEVSSNTCFYVLTKHHFFLGVPQLRAKMRYLMASSGKTWVLCLELPGFKLLNCFYCSG